MHHLSGKQIHEKFRNGEFSAVQIARHFLERIEKYDGKLGAFLWVLKERCLKQAQHVDNERSQGRIGKLAGVPIAIKDNIHIQGEITSCASQFLTNFKAPFNATVVELLEKEGALIVGKTNLDEFAMGSSNENSALKETSNPLNLDYVPGGSSGGSAAAVGARLCSIALGSDTGGSIRQPASFCGLVGFKPTYGRVSRFGLVAFASSLDQIGPIATCMDDIRMVMEVLGTHCEKDSTSIPEPSQDYFSHPSPKTLTVGIPWSYLGKLDKPVQESFEKGLAALEKKGAKLISVDQPLMQYSTTVYYILAPAEASTNLARFDGVRYGKRAETSDLSSLYSISRDEGFGMEVKRRIMLGTYVLSSGYQEAFYRKAQKVRTLIIQDYEQAFKTCDFLAMPSTPHEAFKKKTVRDPLALYLEDIYTVPANLAGLPAISIPCGHGPNHLPLGLQLIGPQRGDVALCALANDLEKELATPSIPDWVKD